MAYNSADQLVSTVTQIDGTGGSLYQDRTFWYDGIGRRILMRVSGDSVRDRGTWRYFWFGDHVGVKTYNPNDSAYADFYWPRITRTSGQVTGNGEWYFYGPGVDNVIASWDLNADDPKTRKLFHKDFRGSVIDVQNDSGRTLSQSSNDYTAFGKPTGSVSGTGPGYNGAESAGGLVYLRNRWYDPNTGRFTQEDPIGYAGGINLYAYSGNDPISFSDPFGLRKLTQDEVSSLGDLCFEVDCSLVEVYDGSDTSDAKNALRDAALKLTGGTSITLGYHIFLANRHVGRMDVLAHEMVHVIQFARLASLGQPQLYFQLGLATQSINWLHRKTAGLIGRDEYAFGTLLADAKPFGRYRMEQQASIVQSCYNLSVPWACQVSPWSFPHTR